VILIGSRHLSLARLPTPVQRCERLSNVIGAEVFVKRDDLTGLGLSGNKVRKLEMLLADATSQGADTIITCGGIQSNHCRATAVAARMLGLRPVLLLRGVAPQVADGNLLLNELLGAELHWCSAQAYRDERDSLMMTLAAAERTKGYVPYVIPEGGSNACGSLGYRKAGEELLTQVPEGFDRVVVAVGSGGTLAGLALGPQIGSLSGVMVCDDASVFQPRVQKIIDEVRNSERGSGAALCPWELLEGYQGPGYGVATPQIWATIRLLAETEGLILDPVYTGKAMHALVQEVRAGRWSGRILFWHTGGAYGLFGRGAELAQVR